MVSERLFITDSELFAAGGAAGGDDVAATFGLHSGKKAVHFVVFALFNLGDWHDGFGLE